MLRRKSHIVVGLTTFNTEMLKISVSALAQIKSHFSLIIYNDNPDMKLGRHDIRTIGYRGKLHVINGEQNIGLRRARLKILDTAKTYESSAEWIIYVDDDDILLNIDIPNVAPDVFAIIQNCILINTRVSDLITAIRSPGKIAPDGDNIVIQSPHLGLCGNPVRIKHLIQFAKLITDEVNEQLRLIDDSLEYRPPVDQMMWAAFNAYMRHFVPNARPIFMNSVNYIQNNIDTDAIKYGRPGRAPKNHAAHLARAMARYDKVILAAIAEQ